MTEIPGLVERVAEAIYETTVGDEMLAIDWIEATAEIATRRRAEARAAIAAVEGALRDAGYAIVPREPTEEMLSAVNALVLPAGTASGCYQDHNPAPADAWQAMVAAAHTHDVSK